MTLLPHTGWPDHLALFANRMLADFTWDQTPVAQFIDTLVVAAPWGNCTSLFGGPGPHQVEFPTPDRGLRMMDNEYDEAWWPIAEHADLFHGEWVHPDTFHGLHDPPAVAGGRACIEIGCADLSAPHGGRPRFDPSTMSWTTDQGVISFPVHPWFGIEAAAQGADGADLARAVIIAAVAWAVTHEAAEMWQATPGVPVVSPHNEDFQALVAIRGGTSTVWFHGPV